MTTRKLLVAFLLISACHTHAALEVYFGEDVSPHPIDGPDAVPTHLYPNSRMAASNFLSRLDGVITASFEGVAAGSALNSVAFGSNIATFLPPREVGTQTNPSIVNDGAFAAGGSNYITLDLNQSFTLSFNSAQSAFGFYGMGVELNQFGLRLLRTIDSTQIVPVHVTVPQGSGGVFYIGVIDMARPFTGVVFENLGTQDDTFIFDELTIAVPGRVPSPLLGIRVSQVELWWETVSNEFYQLQYRSSLTTNVWLPFGRTVKGNGLRYYTNDIVLPEQPKKYYQVVITNVP